jgi:hypothetical protein
MLAGHPPLPTKGDDSRELMLAGESPNKFSCWIDP